MSRFWSRHCCSRWIRCWQTEVAELSLNEGIYLLPSAAGAYYAAAGEQVDPSRQLLRALFRERSATRLSEHTLLQLVGMEDIEQARELLKRTQELGWLQGLERPRLCPDGTVEDLLPGLLEPLSGKGKAMLADPQGFYLGSAGFPHETAEELSALSADLASLQQRHSGLLLGNLGLGSGAWGVMDAAGNSQVGFWPLHVDEQRFALVLSGVPRMNQQALVDLIWILNQRYGQ